MTSFIIQLPEITSLLGNYDLPLIWTAVFILDTCEDASDCYIIVKMNCYCADFTSYLELAHDVAESIIERIVTTTSST
ncbi:hypothetical protein KZO01_26500 [Kurthia zopfii]|nr:hypothetical protein [Kurthia zopfii]GEK32341.1 hypothetical protein KZO01_26500 [Kurthia zopfii]